MLFRFVFTTMLVLFLAPAWSAAIPVTVQPVVTHNLQYTLSSVGQIESLEAPVISSEVQVTNNASKTLRSLVSKKRR
jgi:hypothetical protein